MNAVSHYLVFIICMIVNLIGLLGLVLVFFPGLTVSWVGQLIWVLYVGFNKAHGGWEFGLTIAIFVLNTLLMIGGSLIDNILGAKNTRDKGVPWWEILVTFLAMILGGIFLTPIGGLALALATLFLLEYYRLDKDKEKAWEATKALAFGYGTAAIIRFVICLLMIALWLLMVFFL